MTIIQVLYMRVNVQCIISYFLFALVVGLIFLGAVVSQVNTPTSLFVMTFPASQTHSCCARKY